VWSYTSTRPCVYMAWSVSSCKQSHSEIYIQYFLLQAAELRENIALKRKDQGKFLCVLNQVPCHEDMGKGGIAPRIPNLGNRWRWVIFTPRPLYLRGTAPSIHWIGGCVDPRASLDAMSKSCSCWQLITVRPIHSLVTALTELPPARPYNPNDHRHCGLDI
jgi:hypothetical protein